MLVDVRPSNEALLRARVPGAQDQHGCPSIPFIVRVLRARRAPGRSPPSLILELTGNRQSRSDRNHTGINASLTRRTLIFPACFSTCARS
jgi:hypothetical protein